MYVNNSSSNKKSGILKIEDNFATLLEVKTQTNGNEQAKFQFSFKISQLEALKENAYSVLITIRKPSIEVEPSIVPMTRSGVDVSNSRNLINNVLTHKTKLLKINNSQLKNVIVTRTADITSKINNQILRSISTGDSLQNLGFNKMKIMVKERSDSNIENEIKNKQVYKNQISVDDRKARIELLKIHSTSPADVSLLGDNAISAYASLTGTLRKDYRSSHKPMLSQLSDLYTSKNKDQQTKYTTVVEQAFEEFLEINTPIIINNFLSLSSTSVVVSFELLKTIKKSNGGKESFVLDRIDKTLNLLQYLGSLQSLTPPTVELSFNEKQVFIYTKHKKDPTQISSETTNIKIYKRTIDEDLKSRYSLLETKEIRNGLLNNFQRYSYDHLPGEISIYRVCMEGSCEFSDVVFKSPKNKQSTKLIITPSLTPDGVNISVVNNALPEVIAARLLYKNTTIKQKSFSFGSSIKFDEKSKNGSFSLTNLVPYHVYEFTTKLTFKNGIEKVSNYSTFLEYVPFSGNIDAKISELSVGNDVQFSVVAEVVQDQVGFLLSLLTSQLAGTYDTTSLSSRPANLDKFIAFNIIRYNLDRGDVDNLGIIENKGTFIDSQRSSQVSSRQLIQGDRYKYVIYPLVRDPNNVLTDSLEVRDPETRKIYKLNPRKHRHPLTLRKGTIVSKNFLDNDPKDDMLYGSLGTSIIIDATIPKTKVEIEKFSVSYFDRNRIILNWNVSGTSSDIDHFVIFKEIDGIKSIIGKSHCFNTSLNYIYETSKHDIGNIRFSLLPIYMDYSSGAEFSSNYILIS